MPGHGGRRAGERSTIITGVVLDPDGHPAPGVVVALDHDATTVTETDGWFRFADVVPGSHALMAHAPELASPIVEVRAREDESSTVELRLGPAVSLTVDVLDRASGAAITTARGYVVVERISGSVRLDPVSPLDRAAGRLAFPALPYQVVTLHVEAPGYIAIDRLLAAGERAAAAWNEQIVLRAGSPQCGSVVDENMTPVAAAEVSWSSRGGPETTRTPAVTGSDGGFCIVAAAGDLVELQVSHPGYLSAVYSLREARAEPWRIVLPRGGQVRGRVVDRAGDPAGGAVVRTRPPGMAGGKQTRADADGYFVLDGIEAAPAETFVFAEAAHARSNPVRVPRDLGALLVVPLVHGAVLRGQVVHASGAPAGNATVAIQGPSSSEAGSGELWLASETVTDRDGGFEIHGLAPGSYQVRAAAAMDPRSPAQPLSTTTVLEAGATDVRIELPATTMIAGAVVSEDGRPIQRFTVRLVGSPGIEVRSNEGRFHIGPVAATAGAAHLEIAADGFVTAAQAVNGERGDLGRIELVRGHIISGRVTDPNGLGVEAALVTVRSDQPDVVIRADPMGWFSITVPTLPVSIQAVELGVGSSDAHEVAAATAGIELRVPALGRLEVRLEGVTHVDALMLWATDPAVGGHRLASIPRLSDAAPEFGGDVAPGDYVVQLPGLGLANDAISDGLTTVVVEAGRTNRIVIPATADPTGTGSAALTEVMPPLPPLHSMLQAKPTR